MTRVITFVVILTLAVCVSGQTKFTNAPTKVPPPSPSRDLQVRELIRNSQVRVMRIDLDPGASTSTLQHEHDMVLVSIGDNDFEMIGPVSSLPMTMHDAEIQVLKGRWPHRVHNKSPHALRLVEVEVTRGVQPERAICGLNAASCRESRFAYNDRDAFTSGTLFETPTVKLAKVEIDARHGMPEHGHPGDHVMIALSDQLLTSSIVGGDSKDFDSHPGDAAWLSGNIVHTLANRGPQKAVFLTIECK